MNGEASRDITGLIAAWESGDPQALSSLISFVYPELRRIARLQLKRHGGGTFESAALANEAWLKLVRAGGIHCESRIHFLALCSQIVRRILVDYARRRGYAKRGGNAVRVSLHDALAATERGADLIALDDSLESLSKIDARKGRLVELRYFGGFTLEEAAEILKISPETAKRDWRMARVWLFQQLKGRRNGASEDKRGTGADSHE